MARTTLLDLQTRALQRVDAVNSQFVTTAELNYLINAAVARLHDILVTTYEDYYQTTVSFSLTAGKESYDLVADLGLVDANSNPLFYKCLDIFCTTGTGATLSRLRLREFNRNELPRINNPALLPVLNVYPAMAYRFEGNRIYFEPAATVTAGYQIEMWYVPTATPLVNTTDSVDYGVVFGWDEYIVNDVAINIRLKEESDVSGLMARQADFERKLEAAAQNRNIGSPARVTDVDAENYFDRGYDAYR